MVEINNLEIPAGYVARMGEARSMHRVLVGKPEGKKNWGDLDVDGRIILKWIFGKWKGFEAGLNWLRIGTDGGRLLTEINFRVWLGKGRIKIKKYSGDFPLYYDCVHCENCRNNMSILLAYNVAEENFALGELLARNLNFVVQVRRKVISSKGTNNVIVTLRTADNASK